jgi:hypothetical protein
MKFSSSEITGIYESLLYRKELNHAKIFGTILSQYAIKCGKRRWGEKTPGHLGFIPLIKRAFPQAKVISIIRDPRDVSLSLRKVPWSSNNVLHHAWHWKQFVQLSERYALTYKGNYLGVKYEDLLSNPNTIVGSICEFLDLEFETQMLSFHEKGTLNFDPEREPWKRKATQALDPTNMMKWVNAMPPEEIKVAELLVSRELEAKGYPIKGDHWDSHLFFGVCGVVLSGLGWSIRKKTAKRWTSVMSFCRKKIARSKGEGYNHP